MCDDKRDSGLNIAELLPNMCDNHQISQILRLAKGVNVETDLYVAFTLKLL